MLKIAYAIFNKIFLKNFRCRESRRPRNEFYARSRVHEFNSFYPADTNSRVKGRARKSLKALRALL